MTSFEEFQRRRDRVAERISADFRFVPLAHAGITVANEPQLISCSRNEALNRVSNTWENDWLDATNDISSALVRGWHDDAYSHWNAIVEKSGALLSEAGVQSAIQEASRKAFPEEIKLVSQLLLNVCHLDVLAWCYEPLVEIRWGFLLGKCVRLGHLPCGIDGSDDVTRVWAF